MYRVHVYNISVFRKLSLTDYICQDFRDVQLSLYSLNCMWDTKIREAVRLMIKKKKITKLLVQVQNTIKKS
jgi:hypothetical protein